MPRKGFSMPRKGFMKNKLPGSDKILALTQGVAGVAGIDGLGDIITNPGDLKTKGKGMLFSKIQAVVKGFQKALLLPASRLVNVILDQYSKVMIGMYLVRVLFAIFIIIVAIWSTITGGEGTATPLYHVYSILKSIAVILLIIATIFNLVQSLERARNSDPSDFLQFELAVLASFLEYIPYVYDLIAIVILLGILKAYYIRGCGNKNPNVYPFVDIITTGPMLVFFVATIITVLFRILRAPQPFRDVIKSIAHPLSSVSVALLLVYIGLLYFENMVTNNLAYWMNLYDETPSSTENCQGGEDEDGGDSGLEKAKNIIISVILVIFILIIFVIQLVPMGPTIKINNTLRSFLDNGSAKMTEILIK